jgi:sec-independent protein translocase protein TatB
MFGIGTGELLLILVIALIVLGPERMPRVARDVGRVIGELRRTSDELRDELLNADRMVNKTVDVMPTPTMIETAPSPLVEETPATGPDGETLFDREMREARERIKAQQTP